MTRKPPKNIAASVRQRLYNLSRETGVAFELLLTWYGVERLLYRLSRSSWADGFVLKGAMLIRAWTEREFRPTRDLDFLGYGDASADHLASVFRQVCRVEVEPDGIEYAPDTVQVHEIRGEQEYGGQRVQLRAALAEADIAVQIDVGFGDTVTPAPVEIEYPTLLDSPIPIVKAYTRETVIAEKAQAMVYLDMANSRMKDFYDLRLLAERFEFDGTVLVDAIKTTFQRRHTSIPTELPVALTDEFTSSSGKTTQWTAFLRKNRIKDAPSDLKKVIELLAEFLGPPMNAASRSESFSKTWKEGGPWS